MTGVIEKEEPRTLRCGVAVEHFTAEVIAFFSLQMEWLSW